MSDLKWTPIFAWCMDGYESKNRNLKQHVRKMFTWKSVKLCADSARNSGLKFVQYFSEMLQRKR